MDRREFIQAGAAGAALTALAQPAAAGPETAEASAPSQRSAAGGRELVLALPSAFDDMLVGASTFALAREIETASSGDIRVTVRRIGTTGIEAVTSGEADLYLASEHQHATFHPAFVAFAGLPTGEHLAPHLHAAWLAVGGGQDLWDDLAAAHGIKALAVGHAGRGAGLFGGQRLLQAGDFAGLQVASRGLGLSVVAALGGRAVHLDDSELVTAVAERRIDAAEPFLDVAGLPGSHRVTPGLHAGGMALSLGMRTSFWTKLGTAGQAMISGVAERAAARSLADAEVRGAISRLARRERSQLVEAHPSEALSAAIRSASAAAVSQLADQDGQSRRIVDSYRAFRRLLVDGTVDHIVG